MMRAALFAVGALAFSGAAPAAAYVEAMYPLQQVINESEVIAEGVLEKVDKENMTAVMRVDKSLKGKCHYTHIRMNFGGGQAWHPQAIRKHLVVGAPAIIFYNAGRQSQCYLNRFFFQLYGDANAPPDKAWWNYTHIEIRMNRTFNGTVAELSESLGKILSGRGKAPAPSPKIPPMSPEALKALPAHGEPVDEATLPAAFLKAGAPRKVDPKTMNAVFAPHEQGFIRHWLVLSPIPLGQPAFDHSENSQKPLLDKEWFPQPLEAKPRETEKVTIDGTELFWESMETEQILSFTGEASLHIAVVYVVAESDASDLTILAGSDDSLRLILNGKEIHRAYAGRGVTPDQDRVPNVSLKKGVNALQAWVINGGGPSGLCLRFVDKAGQPVKGLRVSRSPTPDL